MTNERNANAVRRRIFSIGVGLSLIMLIGACASSGSSNRGYEMRVRYAEIVGVERVPLPSNAPAGAMVGGFTGLVLSRNKSSGRQVASGVGGAVLGGLAVRALEGDLRGYGYKLQFADGRYSQFITEKGYLMVGDCVAVERGQYANLRRVASVLCINGPARTVERNHTRSAEQCHEAKEQLLEATSTEGIEAASKKVQIICH